MKATDKEFIAMKGKWAIIKWDIERLNRGDEKALAFHFGKQDIVLMEFYTILRNLENALVGKVISMEVDLRLNKLKGNREKK